MKKINILTLSFTFLLILILFVSGCSKSGNSGEDIDTKKEVILGKALDNENVPIKLIESKGNFVEITYEASDANEYDSQIVADWATIFSLASKFNYDKIAIINSINDIPTATLTTSSTNVNNLFNDAINESIFWDNVDIQAVK